MPPTSALSSSPRAGSASPFDLNDEAAYRRWSAVKLERYPQRLEELIVEIRDPRALTPGERAALRNCCRRANMAIYACRRPSSIDKDAVRALGAQLGLRHLDRNLRADDDGVSAVRVGPVRRDREYIPYTNQGLRWHTDGYYNAPAQTIRAFVMHCVQDAARGGENALLDPEIVYLVLRNENPAYIRALMQPDAMTIPANTEREVEIRQARTGPVFSVDPQSGALHMRYTARTRSVVWKADRSTQAAVHCLAELLGNCRYIFRHRLQAGQGLICNNVLHNRSAFEDDPSRSGARLLYRARYYDRIERTTFDETMS